MRLNLQYHTEHNSGYGRFGFETAKALKGLGVELAGDIGNEESDVELAHEALWLSTPPHVRGWYEEQHATIFTMWESTEIPPGFRENLHNFDRVIVPSLQNKELYERFHDDVRYVPLGVDPLVWSPTRRPPVNRDFIFITGGFGPRKGADQVRRAFLRVFPDGHGDGPLAPVPKLIIRARDAEPGPGIVPISSGVSAQGEIDLYASAHCFVSGSKGEGWGLMPCQALASGLPTILGNAHGHAAFAHHGIPLDVHSYKCDGATFWGDGGEWWEPDFDQMCEAMYDVYHNYAQYEQQAMENAYHVGAEFNWERTAEGIIFNLADHIFEPPPTTHVWRGAEPKLFHIRVNKACTFVINGKKFHFEPGQDYWEAADLKRQMIANGHLDLSVWDPNDLGLEDGDVRRQFYARNAMCPTCNQPYNRDQTLKEIFECP